MRSPITLFAFLVLALLAISAAADNAAKCRKKNSQVAGAIAAMCKRDFKAPSRYAHIGYYSSNGKYTVWIDSKCKPAQKVSKYHCKKQFYDMCANGKKDGQNVHYYGTIGCQKWIIRHGSPNRPL
ncbi:hypothetical protein Q7P37_005198 [Cladosporium fusiforme]